MAGWHGGGREGVTRGQGRGDVWRDQTCWTVYVGDQTSDSVRGEGKMLLHSLNALQLAAISSDTSLGSTSTISIFSTGLHDEDNEQIDLSSLTMHFIPSSDNSPTAIEVSEIR